MFREKKTDELRQLIESITRCFLDDTGSARYYSHLPNPEYNNILKLKKQMESYILYINEQYTLEERQDLCRALRSEIELGKACPHIHALSINSYLLSPETLSSDEFAFLFLPINLVPLFINHPVSDIRAVAKWRMKHFNQKGSRNLRSSGERYPTVFNFKKYF